jgi:hypothetical protein
MVNSYRREDLFRKRFSPDTLPTANKPDITYAELKQLEIKTMKEIEDMKLYNARHPFKKKRTYEQVKERVKEGVKGLLNKTKLSYLLKLMKRERELVVDGSTPPKEGFTPPKGGYNSKKPKKPKILTKQPKKPKILTKQPRKPKILTKQPKKPKILTKQPKKPNNNK